MYNINNEWLIKINKSLVNGRYGTKEINKSTDRPTDRPTDRGADRLTDPDQQLTKRPTDRPTNRLTELINGWLHGRFEWIKLITIIITAKLSGLFDTECTMNWPGLWVARVLKGAKFPACKWTYVIIIIINNRIIYTGYKRPLEDKDLWALRRNNQASYIVPKLRQKWTEQQRKCREL